MVYIIGLIYLSVRNDVVSIVILHLGKNYHIFYTTLNNVYITTTSDIYAL